MFTKVKKDLSHFRHLKVASEFIINHENVEEKREGDRTFI